MKSPDFEPPVSQFTPVSEARGSGRFWSRLRSAIPIAIAATTMSALLALEAKSLSQGSYISSGDVLAWAAFGPVITFTAYGLSNAALNHFSNRSQQ